MPLSLCCICQKEIFPHFAYLCKECEATTFEWIDKRTDEQESWRPESLNVDTWPEWARLCHAAERKRRYEASIQEEFEISFSDCPEAEIIAYGEP